MRLRGDELLAHCRAGQGIIVMVEGETQQDDPFFYQSWFGDRAREISFFAHNGWQSVVKAVQELRDNLPGKAVFGILDRDCTDAEALAQQELAVPADGIFRTGWYTLENYLLNPSGWQRVIHLLHRGAPPPGWREVAEIAALIDEAYRSALPLAAHNWVVRQENERIPDPDTRRDKMRVEQIPTIDPDDLTRWGQGRKCPRDLGAYYTERLAALQAMSPEEWPCWVHGKIVLYNIWLPMLPKLERIADLHLISLYLAQRPDPPADLKRLIDRILNAGRLG